MSENLQVVEVANVRGYLDENGTAWLNAEDVARGLGFTQTAKSGNETVRWERLNGYLAEFGHPQKVGTNDFIPETMFYRLVWKSRDPNALKFQSKVADEILPSIRKNGAYISLAHVDPRFLRKVADEIERRDRTIAQQAEEIAKLKPKADYCDRILASDELLPITIIAKDYGMSAKAFNQILVSHKLQYRVGDTYALNQPYSKMDYARTVTFDFGAILRTQLRWTQKGRMWLYSYLKKSGIVPVCEREDVMDSLF